MLGYLTHDDCRGHDPGPIHPEAAIRLAAIEDHLIASGLATVLVHHEAPLVAREQLERVHAPAYIDHVFQSAPENGRVALDGDTIMSPMTLAAARRAAGAGPRAVDLIMDGRLSAAFCAVRPPGHHATRDQAMGFCIFNNVAVAAAHALAAHGVARVAILDFDVHHGNGTEDIFRGDERVLMCSSFQHPFYPHSGYDGTTPNLVAVPLPAGTDGESFRASISASWLPALERFAPEFVLVSAGFDGHANDDMSDVRLVDADFHWITETIMDVASRHAGGRVVSMLEGGYEPDVLARSVVAHLKAMLG
ncbi:MAG: histone deacetylase family protein [Burkholderiaceae bacterium]|nr:histone deacetylase family protein [Burkholderiaceae bacterium]